jgi:hypothetical protein
MYSETFERIKRLIKRKEVVISSHGYDELLEDDLYIEEIVTSVEEGTVIEDYPDFHKGPCCLVLQYNEKNEPIHTVWGLAKGTKTPAVLITAYRPDPQRWDETFRRRNDEA